MSCVHQLCSHLQNASRARHALTAVPATRLNLDMCLSLYRHGFIGSVRRGSHLGPDMIYTPTTCENIATRRLWIELKYHEMIPVLNRLIAISKPSRKYWMSPSTLINLTRHRVSSVSALKPGECLFVRTKIGVIEIREAISQQLGGELLCRVS
ncbi:hypothetical protein PCANB_000807 [Pneumocystis canis]|nr:hypothetical protein PCK1_000900 [Pneumocystis canis]KAG5437376.1 hypothetical protein PCANB_000807 [Pneumocystis canis]